MVIKKSRNDEIPKWSFPFQPQTKTVKSLQYKYMDPSTFKTIMMLHQNSCKMKRKTSYEVIKSNARKRAKLDDAKIVIAAISTYDNNARC